MHGTNSHPPFFLASKAEEDRGGGGEACRNLKVYVSLYCMHGFIVLYWSHSVDSDS